MNAIKTYDVIIIGAGPAGIFTALELAEKGMKILIVEKGQDIRARIATSRNKDARMTNEEIESCFDVNKMLRHAGL